MWRAKNSLFHHRATPSGLVSGLPHVGTEVSVLHVCAWCFRRWPGNVGASHGICRLHLKEAMDELDRLVRS